MRIHKFSITMLCLVFPTFHTLASAQSASDYQHWRLPATVPSPVDNQPSQVRQELGKMLFFDTHLSGDNKSACISCHIPEKGWSDGKAVSIGFAGKPMDRNSQSLINVGYNTGLVMWAGQKKNLEDQISGPMHSPNIMASDIGKLLEYLNRHAEYTDKFAAAYPGEAIGMATIAKAIASFERTIISNNSPFDRWLAGEQKAMSPQQLRGLRLFTDEKRTNCVACHTPPHFTDNGFHNIGLSSEDIGRYKFHQMPVLKGAFKTSQLRDIEYKAPYMHDGSLKTLMQVVEHYNKADVKGGTGEVSVDFKPLHLSRQDKLDLVAFLKALSGPRQYVTPPVLPKQ